MTTSECERGPEYFELYLRTSPCRAAPTFLTTKCLRNLDGMDFALRSKRERVVYTCSCGSIEKKRLYWRNGSFFSRIASLEETPLFAETHLFERNTSSENVSGSIGATALLQKRLSRRNRRRNVYSALFGATALLENVSVGDFFFFGGPLF